MKNFKYILAHQITVWGDFKNINYCEKVQRNLVAIEKVWEEQRKRNKKLFNSNILNLVEINAQEPQKIILSCHPVEYKHYLAQRAGIDLGITPLAVSGIVFCKQDDKEIFLIGKRSKTTTEYPDYYEFVPSGGIDADNIIVGKPVNYKKQILVELKEELGTISNVKKIIPFCLIFDEFDNVYDIGIKIETTNFYGLQIQEYSHIKEVPINLVLEYMKKQNVVITSKRLFNAFMEGCNDEQKK